jgi:hypothetical protein
MQTNATDDLLPFNQRDAAALLGRREGGFLAGRTTPDYDEIVLEMLFHHGPSSLPVSVPN